jgi:phenylalanyl-tRNA synthetase alpha chain
MEDVKNHITQLQQAFTQELAETHSLEALEGIRISYLGRQGKIAALMVQLKHATLEEKRILGPLLNTLKAACESALLTKKKQLEELMQSEATQQERYFDVTANIPANQQGSLHIYTHLIEQLENIFISMGFTIVDGPELETDYYNFEALNIPADHPARDLHDTFWLSNPGFLLRTHTSTVQIRSMQTIKPPLALFSTGRCYRNEATDATHEFMFMQGECLLVDTHVSIANVLATAQTFLQRFFEKEDLTIRVRPGYFPFVEPGFEIDASCPFCTQGCSVCKRTRWIELLGAGLVHPHVLQSCSIDPEKYRGFAFGFGLERLAMIKYNITDIRLFHSSKLSFLTQF